MNNRSQWPADGKVLIVDSDTVGAQQSVTMLRGLAGNVRTAGDCAQAARLYGETTPDLLVIAVRLPDVSVPEWVRRLRRETTTEHPPVILLSTSAVAEDAETLAQGLAAGADDFICKPYRVDELLLRATRSPRFTPPGAPPAPVGADESRTATADESSRARRPQGAEALRLSEARLHQIINATPIGICITDDAGIFEYVNPAYENIYGYPSAELIGRHFSLVVPEPCRQELSTLHDQFIQGKAEVQGEWTVVGKTGRPFTILSNAARMVGADGRRKKKVTFVTDISQRKQAEEVLKQAKLTAEQANQTNSELMAHISHELRTPLASIIGLAEVMDGSPLNEQQQSWLSTVRRSSEQLLDMVNDLADYAHIEARCLEIENIVFSLSPLLASLKETLQPLAERKGLRLLLQSDKLPARVHGDPWRLQQVLLKLLHNGVKFTEHGTVTLRIERQPGPDETACRLVFTVSDTGIGMEPDTLQHLFRPFFPRDPAVFRKHSGTGLGLGITQRLVNLMAGEIEARSRRWVGSTFTFALDFKLGPADASVPAAPVALQTEQALQGRLILVAEDSPLNQEVSALQLQSLGCVAHVAGDGHQAVEMARNQRYDAILMDIQMPHLDGIEAARRIRGQETAGDGPAVPIIALSDDSQAGERRRCLEAGMNDYLAKPLRNQALSALLRRWLQENPVLDIDEPKSPPPSALPRIEDPEAEIRESLKQLVEDLNPSGAVAVLKTTLIHVPKQLESLLAALAERDWETAGRAAHRLKGTAKLYGSRRLTGMLLQVEQKTSLDVEADTLAVDLAGEYELAMRQVKQQIERLEIQLSGG